MSQQSETTKDETNQYESQFPEPEHEWGIMISTIIVMVLLAVAYTVIKDTCTRTVFFAFCVVCISLARGTLSYRRDMIRQALEYLEKRTEIERRDHKSLMGQWTELEKKIGKYNAGINSSDALLALTALITVLQAVR